MPPLRHTAATPAGGRARSDRRGEDRRPIGCGARLELATRKLAVNLLDLSEGGAGVEAPSDIAAPGDEGHLVLGTAVLPVRVVVAEGGRVGLAFTALSPLARETIRDILAEPPRQPDA
ncbi:PilZ domain-containing protein [Roseomonas eburnea]|uniref:PilZ domain-containing protein n=1 Tax=Neoroseomonas eburnea TaxID=1346889 RepID=A0A9X9XCP6_9PROT|nr:PilZ domain-containing protein [Neoroseomonas eburnea]MBR0681482.1 PilZ domain-containing protein [Neoroseomonas eburnea]